MKCRVGFALAVAVAVGAPLVANADPLSVFQPAHVRAIAITPADVKALRALPALDAFGTIRGTRNPGIEEVGSASEAASYAGFALRLPENVPASLASSVRYEVTRRARTSFTFDAAKATAWAREQHVSLQPMPRGLADTTYTATLQPVALVTYGAHAERGSGHGHRRDNFLAVMQAPLPTVTSSGASVETLAQWFAAQPGMPPHLAAEVRAIGDPTQTLPIPVRFDKQTATNVDVDGVHGLAIGDETGVGAAVVWTKEGKIYAVGGTLTQSRVLALANALK